jgi:hypothetical protein
MGDEWSHGVRETGAASPALLVKTAIIKSIMYRRLSSAEFSVHAAFIALHDKRLFIYCTIRFVYFSCTSEPLESALCLELRYYTVAAYVRKRMASWARGCIV